ncbi:hypothetical protein P8M98_002994 [Escherichia coli]|nr:hypothetical protein [Escherichia coli]
MLNNTDPASPYSLSALLFEGVKPESDAVPEYSADIHLSHCRYVEALQGYRQLDSTNPRTATKIAYCEWVTDHFDDAKERLMALGEMLDADGIGLLSKLISIDRGCEHQRDNIAKIWPRLQTVITENHVPLTAVFARFQFMWPEDLCNPNQRLQDLEHLLALYPDIQQLRLAVLTSMQRVDAPIENQYRLLRAKEYVSPLPQYLWLLAGVATKVGQFDEALGCLEQLEIRELQCELPSEELLWEIELARCDISILAGSTDPVSALERLEKSKFTSTGNRITACRMVLARACTYSIAQVAEVADKFLNALEAQKSGASISQVELDVDLYPVKGEDWNTYESCWSRDSLIPFKNILINTAQHRTQRYFRAIFVAALLDEEYEETDSPELSEDFWQDLARLLGDVTDYPEEFEGQILAMHVVIQSHLARPNWVNIGKCWLISEWLAYQGKKDLPYHWLGLEIVGSDAEYARKFVGGVIKQLKQHAIAPPDAYDLVEELVDILAKFRIGSELYQLMAIVSDGDERSDTQFYLGLAAQWTKRKVEAISAYKNVLAINPTYYSAIFNSLLLCTSHTDAPLLELLELHISSFSDSNSDKEQQLIDELRLAQRRCEDREAIKRQIIVKKLQDYPSLVSNTIEPVDISLCAAVALLALFRCANAEPGATELPPIDECGTPFAPVISNRRILFDLLETGLVAVHPQTSLDAFIVNDGKVESWRFGRIRWLLSPASASLIEHLRSLNGNIPVSWLNDIQPLAFEIARGEVAEYLNHLAQERGWPEPGNTEEVADLSRELVNELPVAQTFHLAYLGAMSASDYKQRYPISGQQAANALIKRTGERLEYVRSGRYPAKVYDRPWKLPRSAISFALWGTIMNRGDDGFTQKISELVSVVQSQR